jgi:acylglycerol lipase
MAAFPAVGSARTHDGVGLRTLSWPSSGAVWAQVLLVHGLGEHAGRYDHVARQLAEAGIAVHGYDHRGFGASGGPRAYVPRWGDYHDDLEARVAAARASTPRLPLALYAHSMGGLIALGYVLDARPPPDLLVLSSPGLDSTIAAWKRRAAPILGRAAPRLRIPNGFAPGALSRDPAVDRRVADDPLCQSSSTTRLGAEGFAEVRRVGRALAGGARLALPTYVLHGDADPVVPVEASAILADDPLVTRRVYPGLRHETHNEPEGPSVVADTIAWLRATVDALPAGQAGASSVRSSSR